MPDLNSLEGLTNNNIDWLIGLWSRQEYVRLLGFNPFPWQDAILDSTSKRIVINAARQAGKSTITSADPCWIGKYQEKSLSIVLAPSETQSQDDMEKVQNFVALDSTYPKYAPAATHLTIENGSKIRIVPARQTARGKSKPNIVILDEASQITDQIYTEVVLPMFTDNPGRLIMLSTPFGKQGFFWDTFCNLEPDDPWERYEIRSPWEPIQTPKGLELVPFMDGDEKAYQEERAKHGIKAWFSPRHSNYKEQLALLWRMGIRKYKQEFCCEFVETEQSVFSYDEIKMMFSGQRQERPESSVERSGVDYSLLEA